MSKIPEFLWGIWHDQRCLPFVKPSQRLRSTQKFSLMTQRSQVVRFFSFSTKNRNRNLTITNLLNWSKLCIDLCIILTSRRHLIKVFFYKLFFIIFKTVDLASIVLHCALNNNPCIVFILRCPLTLNYVQLFLIY